MQQSSIITKSIELLDLLGDVSRPQTFTEIVRRSEFNKSTVHRLLSILISEQLVTYNESNKTYMLGNKLLRLARKAWRGFDIQTIALDEMLRLNQLCSENVSIGLLLGNEVLHLRMIESELHWGIVHPPVFNEPAHTTATGKAIAAYFPPPTLDAWLSQYPFTRSTRRSITDRAKFEKELKAVRKNGYAITDREEMDYVVGIAAPIFNFLDEPIAALNIWAPTNRCAINDLLKWSDAIVSSSKQVSKLIGCDFDNEKQEKVRLKAVSGK